LKSVVRFTTNLKNDKVKNPQTAQAEELNYWKIAAFIGTAIFLLSGFMPMVSDTYGSSISLLDLYAAIGQGRGSSVTLAIDLATFGILLTLILYPVTIVLGFVAMANRKVAIIAGILGLICWIGTVAYLAQFDAISYAGSGVFMGIVGAIAIASAFFLRPSRALTQIWEENAVAPTSASK
jgi:hypothetical protein